MSPLSNIQVNLLIAHTTLHRLAWGGSGLFSGLFMLRQGIPAAYVFLTFSCIFFLRYVFRPLILSVVPSIGLRKALIIGTLLQAAQYPILAFVSSSGPPLFFFGVVSALGGVLYFTCYHAIFAMLGDAAARGSQVAIRQALGTAAAVVGPTLGGLALTLFGPWLAFGVATAIELAAVIPLLGLDIPEVKQANMPLGESGMKTGALLFATDGWINHSSGMAWSIIMFQSLGARFDSFGELQAAAALAGALGGIVLGRFIDLGHARSATRLNAVVLTGILLLKAACGSDAIVVATVAIATYMIGGIYIPSIMTAFYNEAKRSPDPLRFQIFAEGGWDVGAGIVGLVATALCISGAPYQVIILLSLPAVFIQMRVLERSYVVLQNAREGREPRVAASATSPVDCGPLG